MHSNAFAQVVPGPHFNSLDERDRTVLYCACRSTQANPEIVKLLIDKKRCTVNHCNGPGGLCSSAQHAVVESLGVVVGNMLLRQSTPEGVLLAQKLLSILQLLKARQADMHIRNNQNMTALQEFQLFSTQMSSCASIASLVSDFAAAL